MIYLEDNHYLPDGIHDIVGKLQEIIVKDNNIEDICNFYHISGYIFVIC